VWTGIVFNPKISDLQTWPVPDVTRVLQDAIEEDAKREMRRKVDSRKEIEAMKDDGRYVLEVY
jgi:sulfite reductase (NADPH) flavoprotein alpha-component